MSRPRGKKPYRLDQRDHLERKPPFTHASLRSLLCTALGKRYQTLGDAEITMLCGTLNFWHTHFHAAQQARALNNLLAQADEAIKTLRETLPQIIAARRPRAKASYTLLKPLPRVVAARRPRARAYYTLRETLPQVIAARRPRAIAGDWFLRRMNQHAEALLTQLRAPNASSFLHRDDWPEYARGWQWLAKVLPVDFGAAIQATNPHYTGGFSPNGPLARVLEAVIPLITGEHVKRSSIAKQLASASARNAGQSR